VSYQVVVLHRPLTFKDQSLVKTVTTDEVAERFENSIRSAGFSVITVAVGENIEAVLEKFDRKHTVFFNCCEGTDDDPNGYDPITGLLERCGYAYTGASDPVLLWSFDKTNMKNRLIEHNIPTPKHGIYVDGDSREWSVFPALVKPANQHGSFGINPTSVVHTPDELEQQVLKVYQTYKSAALVEDFIDGPEFRVYITGNEELDIYPLYGTYYDAEPDIRERIWSYENKWAEVQSNPVLRHELPSVLEGDLQARIEEAAAKSYRAIEARDYGTVDIRVRDSIPYVLDANQNPDISEGYSFAQAAEAGGRDYPALLRRIIELAAERLPEE
jgi:D-alanine-D-alanine ligase